MASEDELKKYIVDEISSRILNDIAEDILTTSIENIVTKNQSVGCHIPHLFQTGKTDLTKPLKKRVYFDCPYAEDVEFGSDPKDFVSQKDILEWLEYKIAHGTWRGLIPKTKKERESLAWAITKSLEQHGSKPHPFLRPAIQSVLMKYGLNEHGLDWGVEDNTKIIRHVRKSNIKQ